MKECDDKEYSHRPCCFIEYPSPFSNDDDDDDLESISSMENLCSCNVQFPPVDS